MSSLHPIVADTTAAALRLHALIEAASDAQFQRSYVASREDEIPEDGVRPLDARIGPVGEHSDPTFNTVADERRLALRSAVERAEQSLRVNQASMAAASRSLERALDAWGGATP